MTGFGGRGVQHLSLQISPKCRPPPCHPVGCLSRPKNNYLYQKFFDVLDLIRGAHPAHSTHTHVRVRIVLSIGEQNILCSREYVPHPSLAVCVCSNCHQQQHCHQNLCLINFGATQCHPNWGRMCEFSFSGKPKRRKKEKIT